MFKKIIGMAVLAAVVLTSVGCSDNKTQHTRSQYGYGYTDYDPYASRYYRQDRYWSYGSQRHHVHCVYDDQHSSYMMRKYRDYDYRNESCNEVNNFITTYNNYNFTPYYMTSGCPTNYYPVYYGYSLFCSPYVYYNAWNNYISTNSYLGFYAWWLGVGLYLAFN